MHLPFSVVITHRQITRSISYDILHFTHYTFIMKVSFQVHILKTMKTFIATLEISLQIVFALYPNEKRSVFYLVSSFLLFRLLLTRMISNIRVEYRSIVL